MLQANIKNIISDLKNSALTLVKSPLRLLTLIAPPIAVYIVLLCVFASCGMYPFGSKSLALCDMHQQVVPLLLDFKDILGGKSDLFFNYQNAAGMNLYGVFLFFISSPFSFLVVFVDKSDMMLFMNVMTMMKMASCAFTANLYFRHCHRRLHPVLGAIFSVMYAFSGYAMLFYQNTIWLDVMCFFPVLLISFEALTKRGKVGGYIFCMCYMLLLNYYLSYMVVVFTLLYFGLYLFINRKKNTSGTALRFVTGSFVAALLSAVVWLPSFAQYLSSARSADIIDGLRKSKFFGAIYTNIPLLLCTGFAIGMAILFFARRKSSGSNHYMALFLLMIVPLIIEPVNKMWHTGDYMSFPVRYGYMLTFMGLSYAAIKFKQFGKADYAKKSSLAVLLPLGALSVAFGVFTIIYNGIFADDISKYAATLWGDSTSFFLILAVSAGFILLYIFTAASAVMKKLSFGAFAMLLSVLTLFEGIFASEIYIADTAYVPTQYNNAIELSEHLPDDDDFHRVKLMQAHRKYFDANLIGGLGCNTISHYTSLTSENYMFAMKRLGYSSYWMEVSGSGGTLFTDALLSVKYGIDRFSARPDAVYRNKNYSIFENEFYLPPGIITDSDLSRYTELPEGQRVPLENELSRILFGRDDLFTEYTPAKNKNVSVLYTGGQYNLVKGNGNAELVYEIEVGEKQTLYFDCFDKVSRRLTEHINDSFFISVNGIMADKSFPNKDSNGLLMLGTFEKQTVTVTVTLLKNTTCASYGVYGLSHAKLSEALSGARTADLTVSGREISGSAHADGDGEYLFINVPYDSGFKAYVNGEETEVYRTFTGFMSVRLRGGENNVRLYFTPVGFNAGLLITAVGAAAAILLAVFGKKFFAFAKKADTLCKAVVYFAAIAVFSTVYLLSVMLAISGRILQ